jgi:hypothetical protein
MLEKLEEDNEFPRKIIFSDEATCHVSGTVNKQNVSIEGSEHPHATVEHIRDSPKVVCMRPVSRSFDRTFSLPKQA